MLDKIKSIPRNPLTFKQDLDAMAKRFEPRAGTQYNPRYRLAASIETLYAILGFAGVDHEDMVERTRATALAACSQKAAK